MQLLKQSDTHQLATEVNKFYPICDKTRPLATVWEMINETELSLYVSEKQVKVVDHE